MLGTGLAGLGILWTLANLGHVSLLAPLRLWWPALLVLWGGLEIYNTLAIGRGSR